MKAYGYVRVSTGKQARDGISLEDQQARITAWAQAHGYDLARIETDAGLSGTSTTRRDGLARALDAVCKEKGTLVVYDLSRLARSLPDAVNILGRITKAGGNLACIVEGIDTATATGELIYGILSAVNAFVARAGRERTRAIIERKQANGEYTGGEAPFGYRVTGAKTMATDPDEQQVCWMIRRLKMEGMNPPAIARRLNGAQVPCRGAKWHPRSVARVLRRIS